MDYSSWIPQIPLPAEGMKSTIELTPQMAKMLIDAQDHFHKKKALRLDPFILTRAQRFENGFPVRKGCQVYVQPNEFQMGQELFYTEFDNTRICTRCQQTFYVESDGYQPTADHPICIDSEGGYNFHIHTQLPVEHLKTFKKADKVDEYNRRMTGRVYALDVESVYTSHGQEVGRVTVVDDRGEVALDLLVKPKEHIYDYVTKYSGLTPDFLNYATETLESARQKILNLINRESILIGHALNGDLLKLGILHSKVIDTSILFATSGRRPSLRSLTSIYLNRDIQQSYYGHCSKEDAVACVDLVNYALRNPTTISKVFQKPNNSL
ncbi:Protein CBG12828 [Caenorhabditis briggsae]|uniref:Protein CBG12828 n=2 Tax=Caenorhabditis briggsae TaxID=6238 RepID=A8XFQ0_CAEBR|nr:Protein CBG12828 [Caenorhabditis briggsae]ULU13113.1 hypothetical protein L3Y34_015954 [Caenorhabditis briggsae]CAP31746.1 Protein CBG12828 [Caenorhabditis briggsae]